MAAVGTPLSSGDERGTRRAARTQLGREIEQRHGAGMPRSERSQESVEADVAGVVGFLASSKAAYMTGQAINVTGGLIFH